METRDAAATSCPLCLQDMNEGKVCPLARITIPHSKVSRRECMVSMAVEELACHTQ